MRAKYLNIISYVEDAVRISDIEKLQRIFHIFNEIATDIKMKTSIDMTKTI